MQSTSIRPHRLHYFPLVLVVFSAGLTFKAGAQSSEIPADQGETHGTVRDPNAAAVNPPAPPDPITYRALPNTLLRDHEPDYLNFRGLEIGDTQVFYYQRKIGEAYVAGDMIRYEIDKPTGALLKRDSTWTDGLPDKLPAIISQQQAEKLAGGDVQYSALYYVPKSTEVLRLKKDTANPVWSVITRIDGVIKGVILDAVTGEEVGYSVPPPSDGLSLGGPNWNSCDTYYYPWAQNANYWLSTKMKYNISLHDTAPTSVVQSHIQSSTSGVLYELAHGSWDYFHHSCPNNNNIWANDIKSWVTVHAH